MISLEMALSKRARNLSDYERSMIGLDIVFFKRARNLFDYERR